MKVLKVIFLTVLSAFVGLMILGYAVSKSNGYRQPDEPPDRPMSKAEAKDYGYVCAKHERHSRRPVFESSGTIRGNGEIYILIQHTDGVVAHCVFSGGQVVRGGEGLF